MYIRGHDIFDAVVSPLVAQVCEVLRREREREIRRLAVNDQQMQGELASYQHSISPSDFMLRMFFMIRRPPGSTPFPTLSPYSTLFRSLIVPSTI